MNSTSKKYENNNENSGMISDDQQKPISNYKSHYIKVPR